MTKLGVSVACHSSPVHLRSVMAQIALQTVLPSCVAVYQNGTEISFEPFIADYAALLQSKGVEITYIHEPWVVQQPLPHSVPLKQLLKDGCELFTKMDSDDIFMTTHLERLCTLIHQDNNDYDFAGSTLGGVLEVVPGQRVKYTPDIKWYFNPTKCPSDAIIFNRAAAQECYKTMSENLGTPDDVCMASVMYKMRVNRVAEPSSFIYVSHGQNNSGPIAENSRYAEQLTS